MKRARKQTKLVITDIIIDIAKIKELSLNEFLVLTYLDNDYSDSFEIEVMSKSLKMNMDDCLTAFNSLMMKGLVSLESKKDGNDKFREVVSLDGMYKLYSLETVESDKKESNNDIWYSIDGRRLKGKPTSKGLYIRNNQKNFSGDTWHEKTLCYSNWKCIRDWKIHYCCRASQKIKYQTFNRK